jgi:hypothetical protein
MTAAAAASSAMRFFTWIPNHSKEWVG